MKTKEWQDILHFLQERKIYFCVHSYDDCGLHDRIYLSGNGFVGTHEKTHELPGNRVVSNVNEIVEGFISGHCDFSPHNDPNPLRHPSGLIQWIRTEIQRIKQAEAQPKIQYHTLIAIVPRRRIPWFLNPEE